MIYGVLVNYTSIKILQYRNIRYIIAVSDKVLSKAKILSQRYSLDN